MPGIKISWRHGKRRAANAIYNGGGILIIVVIILKKQCVTYGALALAGWLLCCEVLPSTVWAAGISEAGNPIIPVQINTTIIQAEVVSSPDKLLLGLGGRRKLDRGTGMLFTMPTLEVQEFCMRGMLIPLDIIWISRGRVVGFHENLAPTDQGLFLSPGPADLVLEVPSGFVKSAGLRAGDRVEFPE
jgi:uncharacterized membrane protein (UPF0127 family)